MKPDLVLTNIGQLATLAGNSKEPKTGGDLRDLSIIEDGAVAIKDGKFIAVDTTRRVLSEIESDEVDKLEFPNMLALPGFIDSHTHLVFGGSREHDFAMKLAGKSYMEILEAGGGILNTLRATRKASCATLCKNGFSYANNMLAHSTTTLEAKSGYGLNVDDEMKILRAIKNIDDRMPMEIIPTFLGAHAIPPEYKDRTEDYVDLVVDEMIPDVAKNNLAEFCDVFCEEGVFSLEQSRRILKAAREVGMKLKVHADEIVHLGGAGLAAELDAVSADHLLQASESDLEAMKKAGTIATLLPATAFSLDTEYADARNMIEMELPIALATDFNPNCANESMFFTIALACYKMKMHPREAISAATINAAHALDRGETLGSIEVDKKANMIILECPNPEYLSYRFAMNLTHTVLVNGQVVNTKIGP
ncbi:MAG: imidazolonepropionase [Candidatus Thorarchaeota archaeon]